MKLVNKTKKDINIELNSNSNANDFNEICSQQIVLKGNKKIDIDKVTEKDFLEGLNQITDDYKKGIKLFKNLKCNFDEMYVEQFTEVKDQILPALKNTMVVTHVGMIKAYEAIRSVDAISGVTKHEFLVALREQDLTEELNEYLKDLIDNDETRIKNQIRMKQFSRANVAVK